MTERPLVELTLNRLREFWREPGAVFWTFGFPVLLALGLGIAFRERPPATAEVALVGGGAVAERVAAALEGAEGIELRRIERDVAEAELRSDELDLVLHVEPEGDGVRYRYDPQRPPSRTARLAVDDALQRALGRTDPLPVEDEAVREPGGRYIDFLLPGLIGLNVLSSSLWGLGFGVVMARKGRLLKRLVATPMRRSHYLLSFMLSRLVFLVIEVAVLLALGALVFGVVVHGSWLGLCWIALLGTFSFTGLGLLLAARPQSIEAASGWINAASLPMWLLSGVFFSYHRFPELLHPVIRLLPLTAFNDALREVMNEGAPAWGSAPEMAVLAAWGVLSFLVALRIFRWQ